MKVSDENDINDAITRAHSYVDFKRIVDDEFGGLNQVHSSGNFHMRNWNRFKEAINKNRIKKLEVQNNAFTSWGIEGELCVFLQYDVYYHAPQEEENALRSMIVPLKKSSHAIAAEQASLSENDGIMTVTTDNSKQWKHQVKTDRFPVKPGDLLQVSYNINATEGGMIAFDLLNTKKAWYFKGAKRVILKDGDQTGTIGYEIPEGEREASLVFYNDKASLTPTQLTIHILTIENTPVTE